MVLLDTDICIYLLNQRPGFEAILRRLDGRRQGEVALSAITLAELRFGIAASQHRAVNLAKLELLLATFEIAPFDAPAAAAYGSLRAHLQARGTPMGPLDTLIAAHALALGAAVVTNNVREFGRVPGLTMENWLDSP